MKKVIATAAVASFAAAPAFANTIAISVPEISAAHGVAALAAVGAVVLLVWERRRRAV